MSTAGLEMITLYENHIGSDHKGAVYVSWTESRVFKKDFLVFCRGTIGTEINKVLECCFGERDAKIECYRVTDGLWKGLGRSLVIS